MQATTIIRDEIELSLQGKYGIPLRQAARRTQKNQGKAGKSVRDEVERALLVKYGGSFSSKSALPAVPARDEVESSLANKYSLTLRK